MRWTSSLLFVPNVTVAGNFMGAVFNTMCEILQTNFVDMSRSKPTLGVKFCQLQIQIVDAGTDLYGNCDFPLYDDHFSCLIFNFRDCRDVLQPLLYSFKYYLFIYFGPA